MRNGFLIFSCLCLAGCTDGASVDPDTIGIGPVPDVGPAGVSAPPEVIEADKADLNCLLQEIQIALAQAPAEGKVAFTGLQVCKLAPES